MKHLSHIFLLILCLSFKPSIACLNSEKDEIPGISYEHVDAGVYRLKHRSVDDLALREFLVQLESCKINLKASCADIVATYIYLQKVDSAHFWSEKLLRKFPEMYTVVINHAVVLELQGKPKDALVYLKKALVLNPHSHKRSEWIHQLILENVIAGNTNPKKSILGLDFGEGLQPNKPDSIENIARLLNQLHYQLEDRLFFVELAGEKDPLFGSLLFDYANLLMLDYHQDLALEYFKLAQEQGFEHPELSQRITFLTHEIEAQQYDVFEDNSKERRLNNLYRNLKFWAFTGFGLILVIIVSIIVWNKTKSSR